MELLNPMTSEIKKEIKSTNLLNNLNDCWKELSKIHTPDDKDRFIDCTANIKVQAYPLAANFDLNISHYLRYFQPKKLYAQYESANPAKIPKF